MLVKRTLQKFERIRPILTAPKADFRWMTPKETTILNQNIMLGIEPTYELLCTPLDVHLDYLDWLADVLRFVKQQNAVLDAYERQVDNYNAN